VYTPSAAEVTAGTVTLTLTSTGQLAPCAAATDQVTIAIQSCNLEGCTPGFWKNAKSAWGCNITGSTLFFSIFTGVTNYQGLEGITFDEALNLGGGGFYALVRHAAAAYLNACNAGVDYPYTITQIVTAVRTVFNGGTATLPGITGTLNVNTLKDALAAANELGCPLNNSGAVQSVTTRALESGELTLLASPNPYNSNINFNFVSPVSGVANLEIYDLMGRKLAKVFEGQVEKGIAKTIYYRVPSELRVPMIYRLTIGNKTSFGKLLPGSTD
jgi:hypothetical protein